MSEVIAVNLETLTYITDDGEKGDIVQLLDWEGDETDDPAEARSAIARRPQSGWWAIDLSCFEQKTWH
jgi:hypothetical protein